jgi:hypothetical protein
MDDPIMLTCQPVVSRQIAYKKAARLKGRYQSLQTLKCRVETSHVQNVRAEDKVEIAVMQFGLANVTKINIRFRTLQSCVFQSQLRQIEARQITRLQ